MIVYTVQNKKVLETLLKDNVVYPISYLNDKFFGEPYQWMYKQMKERNIPLNIGNGGMFWGCLDQREAKYISGVLMVLDIPESEVLMSDFMGWHFVLNNSPFVLDDINYICSEHEKEKTWENIFKIKHENGVVTCGSEILKLNEGDSPIIQLCFTKILKKWLKSYKSVKRKNNVL